MIGCYIIGEISTVESLCDYVNNLPLTILDGYSFQKPDFFHEVYTLRSELVFVDAGLLNGDVGWLSRIRQFSSVIVISDHPGKAYDAFEHFAFDYLLKPLPYERFVKSINKFNHLTDLFQGMTNGKKSRSMNSFFIKADSKGFKEVLIKCDELIFIEALQNYVILHMHNGIKFTCYNTLKEMEEHLISSDFSRVHKSFIINDSKIASIEGNTIQLCGTDVKILIGNTYKKAFLDMKNTRIIKKHKPTQVLRHPSALQFVLLVSGLGSTLVECFVTDLFQLLI